MLDNGVRSILIATDLGTGSDEVMRLAAGLALRTGAELHAVHVLEEQGPRLRDHGFDLLALQSVLHERRAALEEQLRRTVPEQVSIASRKLEHQAPAVAIVRRAKEVGADLIVVGPHRARLPGSHLLGTTAQRVVQEASVPCLVGRGEIQWPLRKVLLPVGQEDVGRGLLLAVPRWISALVRNPAGPTQASDTCELRVLHVVRSMDQWREFSSEYSRAIRAAEEDPRVDRRIRLRQAVAWSRSAGQEIVRLASGTGAGLIAMGVCGKGPLLHAALGSVSSVVLRHSDTPVLLFPPQVCERARAAADVIPFPVRLSIR